MSKDKIRPLILAVADLPAHHTGLALGVVKELSGPNQDVVAKAVRDAIASAMTKVAEAVKKVAFERNEHGHVVITFQGLDLTGAQENVRLEEGKYNVLKYAKQCFMSTKPDSYDANHRLVAGREYKIALMPTREIETDSERTTENLRKRGMEHYKYGKPLAGHIPRIREKVSDVQIEEMGVLYIASLHDPIEDSDGSPSVLCVDRYGDGRKVGTGWGRPCGQWDDFGCVAFPVSPVT